MDDTRRILDALDGEIAATWAEHDELEGQVAQLRRDTDREPPPVPEQRCDVDISELLAIPRPRTRADCIDAPRPCPWVGCRHHMLLEIGAATGRALDEADRRPTTIRLNERWQRENGRRGGLRASAAEHVFRRWLADALELLLVLPYSCSLDVVDDYPDGLMPASVGWLFGIARQSLNEEECKPHVREALQRARREVTGDELPA